MIYDAFSFDATFDTKSTGGSTVTCVVLVLWYGAQETQVMLKKDSDGVYYFGAECLIVQQLITLQ